MDERQMLLRKIQVNGFAMGEALLFLDTHPDDQMALDYFKMRQKQQQNYMMEYTKKYGPLTAETGMYENRWTWVDGPWPWEYQMEAMT